VYVRLSGGLVWADELMLPGVAAASGYDVFDVWAKRPLESVESTLRFSAKAQHDCQLLILTPTR